MATLHCSGLASWMAHPFSSSKNVHLPYGLPSRRIFGRSSVLLNCSASSRCAFSSSSTPMPRNCASFSASPSAKKPEPILHPCLHCSQVQGGANAMTSFCGVLLVISVIIAMAPLRILTAPFGGGVGRPHCAAQSLRAPLHWGRASLSPPRRGGDDEHDEMIQPPTGQIFSLCCASAPCHGADSLSGIPRGRCRPHCPRAP